MDLHCRQQGEISRQIDRRGYRQTDRQKGIQADIQTAGDRGR
jgi:hypothetical protein